MGDKKIVATTGAPKAIGPYSQAVNMDGWLFLSGQIPLDPEKGEMVSGGIAEQTKRALENLGAVLESGGGSWKSVVKTTVFLKDLNDFQAMNEVYASYFGDHPPARACVEVARLPKDARVEIDAIARVG